MSRAPQERQPDGRENHSAEKSPLAASPVSAQRRYSQRVQQFLARGFSPLVGTPRSIESDVKETDKQFQLLSVAEEVSDVEVIPENLENSQDSNSVFTDSRSQVEALGTPTQRLSTLHSCQSAIALTRIKDPRVRSLSATTTPSYNKTPSDGVNKANPFDPNVTDNLRMEIFSPSVFAVRSPVDSSNTAFKWSPEQYAIIYPAKFDESCVTANEKRLSSAREREIQAVIDEFFERNFVHPSPQLFAAADSRSSTPTPTPETPLPKRVSKKGVNTVDAICQTLFTFPPNFDMDFFLGRSRFRLPSSRLSKNKEECGFRRKLFLQNDLVDELPMDFKFVDFSTSEEIMPNSYSMEGLEFPPPPFDEPINDTATCKTDSEALRPPFTCDEAQLDPLNLSPVVNLCNRQDLGEPAMGTDNHICTDSAPKSRNADMASSRDETETMLSARGRVNSSTPANGRNQKWSDTMFTSLWNSDDQSTTTNERKGHPTVSKSLDSGIVSGSVTSYDNDTHF